MNKTLEVYSKVREYLSAVSSMEEVVATDHGWVLFEHETESGEITIAAMVQGVRIEVRRVILKNDEVESTAQSIVGELLLKIDECLKQTGKN